MPTASPVPRLRAWLRRVWHWPDQTQWMDPLPTPHRRGIIAATAIILLAFLWPSSPPPPLATALTGSPVDKDVPLQAEIVGDLSPQRRPTGDSQGQWHAYTVAAGQTLAQLFREHHLPVTDVFAMAQVEGSDKPLSTLQTGQRISIRLDKMGRVTGLTLTATRGEILFIRQDDGSFIRAQ